jgi:hypothetical protein
MIPQRKNNYYRTSGMGDSFKVDIDPVTRPVKSFCEELILNSQEIYDNKDGKLYCMYSGGIDSELVMEVFLSQGMDITPVIVKMAPDYNNHDLTWAEQYCQKKDIDPLIITIDLPKFIESGEIVELAHKTHTSAYQFLSSIKAALSIDGTIITGQDEPYIGLDTSDNKWYFQEKLKWCAWAKLYEDEILKGTSCFLSWSAETMLSFMLDPVIQDLGNGRLPGKTGTLSSRKHVYGRMFPMPERTKYTGWEHVEQSELFHHENLQEVIQLADVYSGQYNIEYNELVKLLSSNHSNN